MNPTGIARKFIRIYRRLRDRRPLVSVVIPCFNYGRYIEEAIDSVLLQTWKHIEIVVVDDGSDDPDTLNILSRLKKPKTHLLRQNNGKLPKARNMGIRFSSGKYICCLDADDKLAPAYLEKCVTRLENENYDICGSWQQNFGDSFLVQIPGEYSLERLLRENCLIVASVFRRDMWESVGGYDETMIDGYEDWEFWIRMAAAGARAVTVQEPLFWYRKHGATMIDEALSRHEHLVTLIQKKYSKLYKLQKNVSG